MMNHGAGYHLVYQQQERTARNGIERDQKSRRSGKDGIQPVSTARRDNGNFRICEAHEMGTTSTGR
ncbi:MAG: hypothetical protein IIY21_25165 [Clostridiales bacterium]|nr:hypothetical protein [Clostridiales bacterium]